MSIEDDLKDAAAEIFNSTPKAPEALAKHLLKKENWEQLVALAKFYLATVVPKHVPPKPAARQKDGIHRRAGIRPLVPTPEQKEGALRARANIANLIFEHRLRGGRALGEIRVHELPAIVDASAHSATEFLNRGYEDTVDTFLCASLADHCVAAEPFSLVKDTVSPRIAAQMMEKAKLRAANVIRDKTAKLAKELIALAHAPA